MLLFMILVTMGVIYKLGHGAGEIKERHRHERAVKEATDNITAIGEWRR